MKKIYATFLLNIFCIAQAKELPLGWQIGGSNPQGYDISIVHDMGHNPPVATIRSGKKANNHEFATILQRFYPKSFLGTRIQMTVSIKSDKIDAWAGAWLRIDDQNNNTIAFDNMQKRPITGTTDWTTYAIVLDVSNNASSMHYGVLLSGSGQVWIDEFSFEVVSQNIAVTDLIANRQLRNAPINNSF